jgi:FHS family L-fucose permease-like MFS transporter
MAIVGGAILPLCAGVVADHAGLSAAFWLPFAAYCLIATFALISPAKERA